MIKLYHSLFCKWYWFKILTFYHMWRSHSWKVFVVFPLDDDDQLTRLTTSQTPRISAIGCFSERSSNWTNRCWPPHTKAIFTPAALPHSCSTWPSWLWTFSLHSKVSASRWKLICGRLCSFRFTTKELFTYSFVKKLSFLSTLCIFMLSLMDCLVLGLYFRKSLSGVERRPRNFAYPPKMFLTTRSGRAQLRSFNPLLKY